MSRILCETENICIEKISEMPEDKTFGDYLNKDSVSTYENAKLEKSLENATTDERYQFVRNGYFIKDSKQANTFNNIVNLKDTWAKMNQ